MNMHRSPIALLLAALVLLCAHPTGAAPVYSYQYVFGQDHYDVPVGGTIEVPVYLQETVGGTIVPVLAPGGLGVIAAGVYLETGGTPQPLEPARILSATDILENPAFDFPTPSLTPTGAKLALGTLLNPAVNGFEQSSGVYRVLLGTFRFTAGSLPGETTPLRATDYDPGFADLIAADSRVLDASPIQDGTATITTVVPEPGTLVLVTAAAFSLFVVLGKAQGSSHCD